MTTVSRFKKLALFISDVTGRRQREYEDFLSFYRELVETMPTDVCKTFGNMSVTGNDGKNYGIMLTVADYMYWKDSFAKGVFFKHEPEMVIKAMMKHLSESVEHTGSLTPDERKNLLSILLDQDSE